jgi:hypothetical protein
MQFIVLYNHYLIVNIVELGIAQPVHDAYLDITYMHWLNSDKGTQIAIF